MSNTVTTSAMNALGAVTTSVETLQEKVKDSAGKIKDRVTTTTTETGKEMVNGVATTYKGKHRCGRRRYQDHQGL